MTLTHITDHEARALARLIEQYKGKPRITSIITEGASQIQELEDVLFDMITSRAYPNAVGEQLDQIGAIVGIARTPGDDDATYRLDLASQINQNNGAGTPENIIDALIFLSGATNVELNELYPAAIQATINAPVLNAQAAQISAIVQGLMPAGVSLDHVVSADADNAFCFENGDGGGFGDYTDLSVGGKLASLIGGLNETVEVPLATKAYDISFTAEPYKDIDVSAFAMPLDAQRCEVTVLDRGDSYRQVDIAKTAPNPNTIRIGDPAGLSITKNFRILIVQAEV